MENKYYTPSIEEFHPGYRFENNSLPDYGWVSMRFNVLDNWKQPSSVCVNNIEKINEEIKSGNIRTKFLNRSDIEELGWKYHAEIVDGGNVFISSDKQSKLFFTPTGVIEHNIYIETIIFPSEPLFCGTIRNYNELERLMRQLNIK